ncbi:MAG: MBOAT family O-acyltransferase [Bacteroidota bacterium]
MLFNSLTFAIFFPLVFLLYWFQGADLKAWFSRRQLQWAGPESGAGLPPLRDRYQSKGQVRNQNILLLMASYVFYGWWDWRFLGLIALSSGLDFVLGLQIGKTEHPRTRKYLVGLSLGVNLGLLGFFKYFNFFVSSFVAAFAGIGIHLEFTPLAIILPVGISFYTFQTLSYTLDIYRGQLEPSRDPVSFFAFVSFFPQLVAGPIERASNLLPQFQKPRSLSFPEASAGLKQILWGLFKKIVIADNCAIYANQIYGQSEELSGSALALGALYFGIQVYGDFSGYTDIAIGTARLLGFKLLPNFRLPYFSTSISEFWRRWHISLNTWFIDYLYTPLALNKRHWGIYGVIFAIFITFTLSGLWHGANWTFVMWGFLHSVGLAYEALTKKRRRKLKKKFRPRVWGLSTGLLTFTFVTFVEIFFRAETLGHAFQFIGDMFSRSLFSLPEPLGLARFMPWVIGFMLFEWLQRKQDQILDFPGWPTWTKWIMYYVILYLIFNYGAAPQSFIYFQF